MGTQIISKVIRSTSEPNDRNSLWLSKDSLKAFRAGGWKPVVEGNSGVEPQIKNIIIDWEAVYTMLDNAVSNGYSPEVLEGDMDLSGRASVTKIPLEYLTMPLFASLDKAHWEGEIVSRHTFEEILGALDSKGATFMVNPNVSKPVSYMEVPTGGGLLFDYDISFCTLVTFSSDALYIWQMPRHRLEEELRGIRSDFITYNIPSFTNPTITRISGPYNTELSMDWHYAGFSDVFPFNGYRPGSFEYPSNFLWYDTVDAMEAALPTSIRFLYNGKPCEVHMVYGENAGLGVYIVAPDKVGSIWLKYSDFHSNPYSAGYFNNRSNHYNPDSYKVWVGTQNDFLEPSMGKPACDKASSLDVSHLLNVGAKIPITSSDKWTIRGYPVNACRDSSYPGDWTGYIYFTEWGSVTGAGDTVPITKITCYDGNVSKVERFTRRLYDTPTT